MCFNTTKVLVVEDNPSLCLLARKTLESARYEIYEAHNGFEGLKVLREEKDISVVLLDIMMPKMGGMEFLARVEELKKQNHFRICMMTARGSDEDVRDCLKAGADDYIIKPMDRNILIEKIRLLSTGVDDHKFLTVAANFHAVIKRLNSDIEVTVTELSENDISFNSPIRLPVGARVMVTSSSFSQILGKNRPVYLRLTKCLYDGAAAYRTKASFVALNEKSYESLRAVTIKGVGVYE